MNPSVIVGIWASTLTMVLLKLIGVIALSWWIVTAPLLFIFLLNIGVPILIGVYQGLKIRIVNGTGNKPSG